MSHSFFIPSFIHSTIDIEVLCPIVCAHCVHRGNALGPFLCCVDGITNKLFRCDQQMGRTNLIYCVVIILIGYFIIHTSYSCVCNTIFNMYVFIYIVHAILIETFFCCCCCSILQGRCNREKPPCKYFHPPQHLKDQLLINGRNHLALKNALMQQMGIGPGQPVIPGQVPAVVRITIHSALKSKKYYIHFMCVAYILYLYYLFEHIYIYLHCRKICLIFSGLVTIWTHLTFSFHIFFFFEFWFFISSLSLKFVILVFIV